MTPAEARTKHAQRVAKIRVDEALCARDFLTWGDTRGDHAEFCMFVDPAQQAKPPKRRAKGWDANACSRTYAPGPPPDDEAFYEGTGVGALYGLAGSERHLWQLAGWRLTTQKFTPPALPPTEGKNA